MLRSKYFWIAMLILVPFVVVWIMEGFGWAIATFVLVGIFFLSAFATRGRRRRRYYIVDDLDDYDEEIIVERGQRRPSSSFNRAMDLHVPRVSRKGSEFITGASSLRRNQQSAMRRTKKNLWG